jgi:hypothetical protein
MRQKKVLLKTVIFSLILLLFLNNALAQNSSPTNNPDDIPKKVEEIQKYQQVLTDNTTRNEYLMKEWGKILNNSKFGPYITNTQGKIESLNPAFSIILGEKFSFSWFFVLMFFIWLVFLMASFNFLIILEFYFKPMKYAKLVKWIAFVGVFVFFSTIRIPRFLSYYIAGIILGASNWGSQLIMFFIAIVIFAFLLSLSSKITKSFRQGIKERKNRLTQEKVKEQGEEIKKLEEDVRKSPPAEKSLEKEAEEQAKEDMKGISDEAD